MATAVPKSDNRYPPDWEERRRKVYQRDDYECQHCGALGGSRGDTELHAHHIIPISNGGTHKMSNLTTLCWSCHNNQHDHHIKRTDPSADPGGWVDGSPVNTDTYLGDDAARDTDSDDETDSRWDSTQWRVFVPIYLLSCLMIYLQIAPWIGGAILLTTFIVNNIYEYGYK